MRLTDRPRTLTEMTGQSHWPAELQAVLDKALARELDERYRSAGDFGRELTRAVEGMPETALAGAGTLVMSAPGVPPTRISGGAASARTVALDAAPPPAAAPPSPRVEEKRSRVPLMVGGGVAVAAIVGLFAMTQLKDGGAVTPPTDSVAAAADDTGTTQLSSRLPDATPVRPDTAGRRVTTPATSSPRPVESSTTGPASTAYNPEADFNRWLSEAQDTSNVPRARRVITQVDRVVPRLATAMDSAIARYIQAQAWATYAISTEDVAEQRLRYSNVCRVLRADSARIVQTPYSRQARDLLELCP